MNDQEFIEPTNIRYLRLKHPAALWVGVGGRSHSRQHPWWSRIADRRALCRERELMPT